MEPRKRPQKTETGPVVNIGTKKSYVMDDAVCDPLDMLQQLLKIEQPSTPSKSSQKDIRSSLV